MACLRSCPPARTGRSSPCPGRAHADRDDRRRLRRRHRRTSQPRRRRRRLPPQRHQRVLRPRARPRRRDGRLRGRAATDLDRRPAKSVDISRKAELYETSSGMLTITGGKLTTWRRMAKQVVDRLVERDGRDAPCRTARDPARDGRREADLELPTAGRRTLPEGYASCSPFRYGHAAAQRPASSRRAAGAGAPIVEGHARPARRGRHRRAARAGAFGRRRPAAPHPPWPRCRDPLRTATRSAPSPPASVASWIGTRAHRLRDRAVGCRRGRGGHRPRRGRLIVSLRSDAY